MRPGILLLAVSLVAEAALLKGQSPPRALPSPPPQHRVYDHLFRQVVALDNAADDADAKGDHGKANGLRKHFQSKFGLKDNEATVLKGHAKACDQQVRNQDKKAADIIQRERKKYPDGKMPKGQKPPAAPPELDAMQNERNQMITGHVDGLKRDLGATFSKLDQFAQKQYAMVKVKPITPPKRPAGPPPAGR